MHAAITRWVGTVTLLIAGVSACGGGPAGPDLSSIPSVPGERDPGTSVAVALESGELDELQLELDERRLDTRQDLEMRYPVEFQGDLGYDPLEAEGLELIETELVSDNSHHALLGENGFAITSWTFPSFVYGYSTIYAVDAPVFISADMVLEAIYRSHDKILQTLEKTSLRPRLARLLAAMRERLVDQAAELPPDVASDLNFYLGVAISLLDGGRVAEGEPEGVAEFVDAAMDADGEQQRILFGVRRSIDFSQFKPRGHYDGDSQLESYFRSMIWLGRIDLRLIETEPDGNQILRRRQVEAALAMRGLLDAGALADYHAIDRTITAFVGEHDYMTLDEVDELVADLGGSDSIADLDDEELATAIIEGQFGEQRIASHVMRRAPGGGTLPLNASFALLGQRYTVDSHVLSNVVYDRVPTRVVPNSLDVAFAALGNGQALTLLGDELEEEEGYSGQLSAMRTLIDEHPAKYWRGSLYTSWLSALRTLSPQSGEAPADLPQVAKTEAWGRRVLNTQLSSWAELRHNNVLYVKQSYTSGALCEYPDAYVDPYPEFFTALVDFAERAQTLVSGLDLDGDFASRVEDYFANVADINGTLAEMAEAQLSGAPHSEEHLAFVNRAVTVDVNCDGTVLGHSGWYSDLHFEPLEAVEMDPIITDVHTDIGGVLPVSRPPSVLHVGTGLPRLMLMTVDTCEGPRAYAGVVSSYHEVLKEGLTRLTDDEWKSELLSPMGVADVNWMEPLLSPAP